MQYRDNRGVTMYNEDWKCKFISEYTGEVYTQNLCVSLFNALADQEEKWGADICTMSSMDVKPYVENLVTSKRATIDQRIRVLKAYAKWCIDKGYPGACDGLLTVPITGYEQIRTRLVMGPEHLQKCLDDICRPDTIDSTDNAFRVICWLIFNGVSDDDLDKIKASDVNFHNFTYKYHASDHPIYPEAVRAFKSCVFSTEFSMRGNTPQDASHFRNRVDGDILIRGIKGVPSIKAIRVDFSRRKPENGEKTMRLSIERIRTSGRFYRWYMQERMGIRPEIEKYVTEDIMSREHNVSDDSYLRKLINASIRDTIDDYNSWKIAFM